MIIESRCYYPGDNIVFDNIMNKYCTFNNDEWNIEFDKISDIKPLLDSLGNAYDKGLIYQNEGWNPTEIIVDFYYNIITLRDSYIE